MLIGIEPGRIEEIELAQRVKQLLTKADELKANWRADGRQYKIVDAECKRMRAEAIDLMPPLEEVKGEGDE
ncbi:MAG: hypothetical protein IT531_24660 [Burkholderiales bacterium]|nr:hypothetical protein [Burkholderiales bacterium]